MYIRRKVFSIGQDENGEQRLFSTTEIINEETYQKQFATTGEALEKKSKKLMDQYGLTKNRALEVIKERDKIAIGLNKRRNEINSNTKRLLESPLLNDPINSELIKQSEKAGRGIAIADADIASKKAALNQLNKQGKINSKAVERHTNRILFGEDKKIKAKYAIRKARNWAGNNKGKIALATGTSLLAAGGLAYKKFKDKNKDKK